jgi:hypothetical protein
VRLLRIPIHVESKRNVTRFRKQSGAMPCALIETCHYGAPVAQRAPKCG